MATLPVMGHGEVDGDRGGLKIVEISKRYGGVQAVDGLSIDVPRGSLIGFLGPNGSGKTTTMRAVLGMVAIDGGSISWDGAPMDDAVRTTIGYMPQERGLYARMRVHEQVVYFGRLAGLTRDEAARRTDYWLDRLDLSKRAGSLIQELSGGNQQRVQLAVSLVHEPDLLVLDEPFAGLDPVAAETMRAIIDERAAAGCSVLFSSHQLDLVEDLCRQVVIIANGRLVAAGDVGDLRSASPTRRLRVRWTEPVVRWEPVDGRIVSFDGTSAVVELSDGADVAAGLAGALAAGPVSEIAVEPPGLDEVFTELVGERT